MTTRTYKTAELQLADKVLQAGDTEYGVAVVKQVTADEVTLFRPYPATADFSYTGGVICYVGVEEYKVLRNTQNLDWVLLGRKELK